MEPISPWWAILAAAISGWLSYRIGYRQATTAAKNLALSIKKARPHIGSRAELRKFSEPGWPHVTRYSVFTTVYNDGDFVARKVEGEWKLLLSEGFEYLSKKVIRVDSLSTAYPWETNCEVAGNASFYDKPEYLFQVEIDLNYLGLDDEPQQYRARYRYDHQQKAMVSQKLN